jgi:hypothetical protein
VSETDPLAFTVVFYGLKIFRGKTAQFYATRCESEIARTPSVRNSAQTAENARKNSVLNYESPALTAELQARISYAFKHSILLLTNRESIADRLNFGLRIVDCRFGMER